MLEEVVGGLMRRIPVAPVEPEVGAMVGLVLLVQMERPILVAVLVVDGTAPTAHQEVPALSSSSTT
jgi:hypothetical protein